MCEPLLPIFILKPTPSCRQYCHPPALIAGPLQPGSLDCVAGLFSARFTVGFNGDAS